ncbi:hypothetical protein [Sinorhizobium psoraleae]|uniref:LysR substrate-binding domain-containing protein n=1 Tax=Sinorhizobium psoraleae TaxID=520838 RepID=A0ABT4KP41_9HYPH|nr:hypothetical protein [Sinorhizobium psoraleae]MCZ4093737.1 hypothetical protein [Sinorhizobium psoraleae]
MKSYPSTATLWLRTSRSECGVSTSRSTVWNWTRISISARRRKAPAYRLPDDKSVERMLLDGEIDALLRPDLIEPVVRRDPASIGSFPTSGARVFSYR